MEPEGGCVLICDDDVEVGYALSQILTQEGYSATNVTDAHEALRLVEEGGIDLLLLDVMMPGMDGLTCMRRLRELSDIPVILLTARDSDADKIMGLSYGADDYVTKPFHPMEMIARVSRSIRAYRSRRAGGARASSEGMIRNGPLVCDMAAHCFRIYDRPLQLTNMEYRLLCVLIEHRGETVTGDELYREAWQEEGLDGSRETLAVHLSHIRKKLDAQHTGYKFLEVIRGVGYRLEDYGDG